MLAWVANAPYRKQSLAWALFHLCRLLQFRAHRACISLDDLPTHSRRFAARISASVATADSSPGRALASLTADNDFASVLALPTAVREGSAEAPATTTSVAELTPLRSPVQGTDSVEPADPTAFVSTSLASPTPQMMTQFSDHISTLMRRRSATAAGKAPPAVDYGFRPGGPPRPSFRRPIAPPRLLLLLNRRSARATFVRPRPRRACVNSSFTPTPSPGEMPSALTRSDALGDAADLRFADSVARYSHADWKREQHGEPTCHAAMRYISIGRPSALRPGVLACHPSHKRPSLSEIQELAGRSQLHTTNDDIVLLVRNPTPPPTRSDKPNSVWRAACLLSDEPVCIYASLLMHP